MFKNKTVAIAMSGGVDSSVTAALLQKEGYNCIGITMLLHDQGNPMQQGENSDVKKVAQKLNIPHYFFDFRECFNEKVIDHFTKEYLQGRTPNPCVVCNRWVKFGLLMDKAKELGADYLATGHYASFFYNEHLKRWLMKKAVDRHKDQTYFLYTLNQKQIANSLLPLGNYTKEEVRLLAKEFDLPVAEKKESQEICFIPNDDYRSFLRQRWGADFEKGSFLDLTGKRLGEHQGIPYYTIGQRRGLGIATGERAYVVEIRPEQNEVVLGPEAAVYSQELIAEENNLILFEKLTESLQVEAQVRYNGQPSPATISPLDQNRILVTFQQPQKAVATGQVVVFYQGDILVGGGTIAQVKK